MLYIILILLLAGCGSTKTPDHFFGPEFVDTSEPENIPGDPTPEDPNCKYEDEVTLRWIMEDPDIDPDETLHFKLYYGFASRDYIKPIYVGGGLNHHMIGLTPGVPYYFAVTALYANTENESKYSNELCKILR